MVSENGTILINCKKKVGILSKDSKAIEYINFDACKYEILRDDSYIIILCEDEKIKAWDKKNKKVIYSLPLKEPYSSFYYYNNLYHINENGSFILVARGELFGYRVEYYIF